MLVLTANPFIPNVIEKLMWSNTKINDESNICVCELMRFHTRLRTPQFISFTVPKASETFEQSLFSGQMNDGTRSGTLAPSQRAAGEFTHYYVSVRALVDQRKPTSKMAFIRGATSTATHQSISFHKERKYSNRYCSYPLLFFFSPQYLHNLQNGSPSDLDEDYGMEKRHLVVNWLQHK